MGLSSYRSQKELEVKSRPLDPPELPRSSASGRALSQAHLTLWALGHPGCHSQGNTQPLPASPRLGPQSPLLPLDRSPMRGSSLSSSRFWETFISGWLTTGVGGVWSKFGPEVSPPRFGGRWSLRLSDLFSHLSV